MHPPRGIRGRRLDRSRRGAAVHRRFAAAYYDPDGRLVYAGRVGAGINTAELERLRRLLQPLATTAIPLEVPPPRSARFGSPLVLSRVHWVRPELVAEVKYLTWTGDNLLRQVVYEGLREDKPAAEVRREVPQSALSDIRQIPGGLEARTSRAIPPGQISPRSAPLASFTNFGPGPSASFDLPGGFYEVDFTAVGSGTLLIQQQTTDAWYDSAPPYWDKGRVLNTFVSGSATVSLTLGSGTYQFLANGAAASASISPG
jgi:hypothetical protein